VKEFLNSERINLKMKKLLKSFKYAFEGIFTGIKEEQNIKIHIVIMILVIIFGIMLKISKAEWIICIILFGLVISMELINTAIENTVDLITKEKNEQAKIAKDVAAGAVLVSAIASAIIGLIIFVPKILLIF
jgi:hypothetical protein